MKIPACPPARRSRGAFALVITLLILSLLVIVSVSYLSSMTAERQTADAYDARAVAEQAAQTGVDNATALLAQCFRDFPDSATAWDPTQTTNSGTPTNAAIVNTPNNEGTTLYLRAMPSTQDATAADPLPSGVAYVNGGTSYPANDPKGNNPNNPACQTFVLPLISGVPKGQAKLLTSKGSFFPSTMDLKESDPAKQTWTDLNIRRTSGDIQGVIGSPPEWTNTPGSTPAGPKPARAYWVPLAGSDGRQTARYAFWIEDDSFRVNVNKSGNAATRIDNVADTNTKKYPTDPATDQPYILKPSDGALAGLLPVSFTGAGSYAQDILDTRALYPASFMPDPLAFKHAAVSADGSATLSTATIDALRYLTTTQSGTLNLSRHGTQRLNLNTTVTTVPPSDAQYGSKVQRQVNQLVAALQFHLPNFGQRFYRTDTGTTANTLNAMQVPANIGSVGNPRLIYQYKVAANLRDQIDTDSQPTMIRSDAARTTGIAYVGLPDPVQPYGDDGQANPMWAVGKEAAPFLQETAVRYRPSVPQSATPKAYTLKVDYYLEFWNMTDRDIYASPQSDPTLAHLNGAKVRISNQQTWLSYNSGTPLTSGDPNKPAPRTKISDFTIDLTGNSGLGFVYLNGIAQDGSANKPLGVVFRAGTTTVITTDPDYAGYSFTTPIHSGTKYTSLTGVTNPATTFFCPIVPPGTRTFAGPLANQGTSKPDYGVNPEFRDGTQDYQTEVTFYNSYGYLDSALFSIAEGGSPVNTFTDSANADGDYCNYSYGGSLYGNSTLASEMGDPRTSNEQMIFHRFSGTPNSGDLSRFFNGNHTLGYPNGNYVQPANGGANGNLAWPDYYTLPTAGGGVAYPNPDATTAPAVIADKPLYSIGQLGDVFDPARLPSVPTAADTARGGGRTFKIGQRDDRVTYDATNSPGATTNAPLNNVPASLGWASWRLTDVFSAGPVAANNPYGPTQDAVELPGRININGVARDNGAALRTLLTNFKYQPKTGTDPLFHTPPSLDGVSLLTQPTDSYGVAKLVAQMKTRLQTQPSAANVPWGPFFERGELGELQVGNQAIFGQNPANAFAPVSTDLTKVDLNRTFDHGREELFRRISELICTRGDTFTVYAVGQSLLQTTVGGTARITGTQRMRVTFRLVPKTSQVDPATGKFKDFHPALDPNVAEGTIKGNDFDPGVPPAVPQSVTDRFAKPDRYEVQVLAASSF